MTLAASFSISPVATTDGHHRYECVGSIDAHSGPMLDTLRTVPAGAKVRLNFEQVQRVNSMGLSLLLKLFEEWETNGTQVQVYNLNRMISMLFKITGLSRFVEGQEQQPVQSASQPRIATAVSKIKPAISRHPRRPVNGVNSTVGGKARLSFVASVQTGYQLGGWFLLNTYLQRRMQRAIRFEQFQIGQELTEVSADLLFIKPFEACTMTQRHGFLPLMRPQGEADEVVILTRAEEPRSLANFTRARVVTASRGSFVYLLGRSLCEENGLDSGAYTYSFASNEIKALQMLLRQEADLLFMLKKTYIGLSSFSRNATRLLDQSETDFAFHLFCIAPHLSEEKTALSDILINMSNDAQGQQILKDVQVDGWCVPEQAEMNMLYLLYNRYAET